MTDKPIDHTARYVATYNEIFSGDAEDIALKAVKALQSEHDWVIRLEARLEYAEAVIAAYKAAERED